MYTPPSFVQDDLPALQAFLSKHSFATLVSVNSDRLAASHLPLLFRASGLSGNGCLVGHMARANQQWEHANGEEVLAIFHGPHAYISPSWYDEANVVPTWNYSAVHVYGRLTVETDVDRLLQIVTDYVSTYEAHMTEPWILQTADADFVQRLLPSIVGFTIDIDRILGKEKFSQNHTTARRKGVVDGLRKRAKGDDLEIAELMESQVRGEATVEDDIT